MPPLVSTRSAIATSTAAMARSAAGPQLLQMTGAPSGAAPTLVFLHEGLGCVALWRQFPARLCAALGLPYLYLGYWIANSRKMVYKSRFSPIEGLIDGHWQTLNIPR